MAKAGLAVSILILLALTPFLAVNLQTNAQSTSANDDWPMFQHDATHTGYTNSTPIKSKPEVLWRYQTESPISSSLTVSEGLIYVSDQSTT
jgi:PKD repeat protein